MAAKLLQMVWESKKGKNYLRKRHMPTNLPILPAFTPSSFLVLVLEKESTEILRTVNAEEAITEGFGGSS
jgi:hypothetical protein